ncbi:uncharacterized protein [Elaeis guineensis]|uniref:uncharacterized protein n=1 Tax=Elaeis guineensis var. tenera TaxID=51953 RepID=UPI003C6D0418
MESRNWEELPNLALFSVLLSLPSLPDLFSFAGVCRAWRSFLRSVAPEIYLSCRPPLLLFTPYSQSHRRLSQLSPHTTASAFRLHALDHPSISFKSLLPDETLATPCLGYSHGHLLLLRRREVLLADVLTGAEIHPPTLPPDRYTYYYAALTAPPSSPDCRILLFYSRYALLCCRLGDPYPGWAKLRLQPFVSYLAHVLSFKGRIFAVDHGAKLLAFDFDPDFSVEMLKVGGLRLPPAKDGWEFRPRLVECGGELLLVLMRTTRMDVYRLDFGRMVWVEVENLGDFSLFIDFGGKCPVSCANPGSWGGRSNCIYLAGPDCVCWKRYSLDGKTWRGYYPDGKPIHSGSFTHLIDTQPQPHWPSPIWVYPGLFFGL